MNCIKDSPSDASKLTIPTIPGDIIITATDGLFDNISESMILKEISKLPETDDITRKGSVDIFCF